MCRIVLRTCAIYVLIWMIPQLLFIHTAALAEDPHAKILPSLVFLKATAQGNAGADTGVPKSTVATGVIVSDDGLILTVYHLLSELGKVAPETIDIRGSIGEQVDVPSQKVLVISANQPSDLLLADSDEAGRGFRFESGHPFRFESGHRSDLKAAGVASPSGSLG